MELDATNIKPFIIINLHSNLFINPNDKDIK